MKNLTEDFFKKNAFISGCLINKWPVGLEMPESKNYSERVGLNFI